MRGCDSDKGWGCVTVLRGEVCDSDKGGEVCDSDKGSEGCDSV